MLITLRFLLRDTLHSSRRSLVRNGLEPLRLARDKAAGLSLRAAYSLHLSASQERPARTSLPEVQRCSGACRSFRQVVAQKSRWLRGHVWSKDFSSLKFCASSCVEKNQGSRVSILDGRGYDWGSVALPERFRTNFLQA